LPEKFPISYAYDCQAAASMLEANNAAGFSTGIICTGEQLPSTIKTTADKLNDAAP